MKCLTKGTFVGMYTNLLYLQSTAEKKTFWNLFIKDCLHLTLIINLKKSYNDTAEKNRVFVICTLLLLIYIYSMIML